MWLLFYWRLFTPVEADRVQFPLGDFTQQFLVFRQLALNELRQGRLPLWMPCIDSGYPYQADPQSASFYPPALANLMLHLAAGSDRFSLSALELESSLHVLLAALLMYGFLRGETRRRTSALAGALVFGFGGYLTGYPVLQMAIVEAAAWLPLALWGARRLAEVGDARSVALAAAPLALSVLAGHPQTYTFIFYSVALYFLYRAWQSRLTWRAAIVRLVAVAGLAVLLSAVQLLPSLEYARFSTRAELPYVQSATGFPLADVIQLIVSGVASHFNPLYVGLMPLALIGLAIGAARKPHAPFWLSLGVIGLLLSFGGNLAVFDPFYWLMPGYRLFRDQERHALVVALALSVLTAYGADALLSSMPRRVRAWLQSEQRWLGVGVVLLVSALAAVLYLSWLIPSPDLQMVPNRTGLAVIVSAAALAVLSLRTAPPARRWLPLLLIAVVGFDLATANRAVNWSEPADPFPALAAVEAIQADAGSDFRIHNEQRLPGHSPCMSQLEEVGGITPIRLAHYDRFVQVVPRSVRWQLLNVRYLVTWRGGLEDHHGRPVDAARLLQEGEGENVIYVYRLAQENARAWVVHQVDVLPDREAIYQALAAPGFDPRLKAYTLVSIPVEPAAGSDHVSILDLEPNRLSIEAELSSPGLLVVSEVTYPGWTASVDGVEAPNVEVDGLLRGVALPAGASRIEMTYRPSTLVVGAALSGLGVLIGLSAIILRRR